MTVTSVNNTGAMSTGSTTKPSPPSLGQADFLKLLTKQLTMQDPTDPVDNKEMVAQMAQFSSLASMTEMSDTLKTIAAKLDFVLAGRAEETPAEDDATDGTDDTDTTTEIPPQE